MFNGKFLHFLMVAALICAFIKPNLAVSSCWYGGGNQYTKITCPSGSTGSCGKTEKTYQGFTIASKDCVSTSITCDSSITQGATTTGSDGSTTKFWCCTSDNCNFSSTISSNKLLTGFSIFIASFVAFLKLN